MIGFGLGTWLTIAIAGLISSLVVGFLIGYRSLGGAASFFAQWILGYIGGWLGTPVFGNWGGQIAGVAWLPCLIGAFCGSFLCATYFRARLGLAATKPLGGTLVETAPETPRRVA